MRKTKHFIQKALTITSLLIIILGNSRSEIIYADLNEAASFYENADDSIKNAVKKLSELYDSGVNVTDLKDDLNEAIEKLAASQLAINENNYDTSIQLSKEAQEISIDMIIKAASLREQRVTIIQNLDYDVTVAIFKALFVSIVAYLAWRKTRKILVTKMLNSRIEVNKNES